MRMKFKKEIFTKKMFLYFFFKISDIQKKFFVKNNI